VGLLLQGGTVLTQDAQRRVLRGDVRIADGRVAALGQGLARERGDEVLDCVGRLVLPGLVNLHTHSPMTLLRGYSDDLPLERWLRERIWPAEARLTAEAVRAGSDLAMLEMLGSGTTSFNDMYFFPGETAASAVDAGIRGWLGHPILDFPTPDLPAEQHLPASEAFLRRWQGHPRITPTVQPHATYTCSPARLEEAGKLAQRFGAPFHTHCSETRDEVYDVEARHGARPLALLERSGCLGPRTVLAHCGWITKEEARTIARAGASVAHCPVSNLKLGTGGFTPLPELLAAGAKVGLGTDGAASNNTLDLLESAKFAALVHKHHRWDPTLVPAQAALDLATRGGADALGRPDLGRLELGAAADVVVLDARTPRLQPLHDPVSQVVYAARGSDVEHVLVGGEVVVRGRVHRSLDAERVIQRAAAAAQRLVR
jgi:5-methylthioadenosine/S-adenosylhomocysteine deaminase